MKYAVIIIVAITAVFFGSFYVGKYRESKRITPSLENVQKVTGSRWESKIDEQGSVSVAVTPQILGGDVPQWTFDIALNTHSVALDYDLRELAVLLDEKGGKYKPVAWEGAPPGGHHREGVLTFKALAPAPNSVELRISNVGDIPERIFQWSLK